MRLHFVLVLFIFNCDFRTERFIDLDPERVSPLVEGKDVDVVTMSTAKPAMHPPYSEMIATALTSLAERSGSSRQAILKYIQANYRVGNNAISVNAHLKMALKSGLKTGSIKKSKGIGASGCFRLAR